MSRHFLRLKKKIEECGRISQNIYFYYEGYILGLSSAGVLEDGERDKLHKILEDMKKGEECKN